MSILPFLAAVVVICLIGLLLTKSRGVGKNKRDASNQEMREYAAEFATSLSDSKRDYVVGTWQYIWDTEEGGLDRDIWFITPLVADLLSMKNNIFVFRFHEDGTCQRGVLNLSNDTFYSTDDTFALEMESKYKVDENGKRHRKLFNTSMVVTPPYHTYEVKGNLVHIYEDDNKDGSWVETDSPYVLKDDLMFVPAKENGGEYLYAPFEQIDSRDDMETY